VRKKSPGLPWEIFEALCIKKSEKLEEHENQIGIDNEGGKGELRRLGKKQ